MRNWFLLLISVAALAHAAPPGRVEIDYEVTRNGMALADIEHRFEHSGGAYQVTETWTGRGLFYLRGKIRRESRGAITAQGLQPMEYSDKRTGRDTERATFDWNAKTVTVQYQGDPKTLPLPLHPQDRLAFFYQFAFVPPQAGQHHRRIVGPRDQADRAPPGLAMCPRRANPGNRLRGDFQHRGRGGIHAGRRRRGAGWDGDLRATDGDDRGDRGARCILRKTRHRPCRRADRRAAT